jgi:hypothetical protein
MRSFIRWAIALALLGAVALGVFFLLGTRFSEQQVREAVFSAIQRESPEAFLVTGRLDVTVTTVIEDSRILLPGLLDIDMGTARATVRVPGRVSYGFPADSLRPDMVSLTESGAIEVELPALEIYSVEPDLAAMEVQTERGWARLPGAREEAKRQAIAVIEGAFRRQGLAHIQDSYQPRINSARALQRLLSPALQGLGMADPVFRFRLGEGLVVEPSG